MTLPLPQNTWSDASIENWEIRSQEIQSQEREVQEARAEEFRNSDSYIRLADALEGNTDILEAIVTAYSSRGDIYGAIRDVLGEESSQRRLWISFNPQDLQEAITQLIHIVDNKNPWEEREVSEWENLPSEYPWISRISRLVEIWVITTEEQQSITRNVEDSWNLEESLRTTITDTGRLEDILTRIYPTSNPEERLRQFYSDMPEEVRRDQWNPILDLIAEHYVSFPDRDGNVSQEQDFKIALQEAAYSTVHNKQFERTEGFEIAMNTIQRGEDKEEMFIALQEVFHHVNDHEGIRGRAGKERNRIAENQKNQALHQAEQTFAELITRARENANTEQMTRIQRVMEIQQAEAQDTISEGDLNLLWGWDLDVFQETPLNRV